MPDDFERSIWDNRFRRVCPPCPPCRYDRDRREDRRDDKREDRREEWNWRDRDNRRRY